MPDRGFNLIVNLTTKYYDFKKKVTDNSKNK